MDSRYSTFCFTIIYLPKTQHALHHRVTPNLHTNIEHMLWPPGHGEEQQEEAVEEGRISAPKTGHPTNPTSQTQKHTSMPAVHTL